MTSRTAPGLGIPGRLLWTADQLRADPLMRYLLVATCLIGVAGCMPLKPRAAAPAMPEAQSSITREQAAAELVTARALIVTSDYAKARGHVTPVIADAERWGWLDVESDAHFLLGELFDRERKSREAADAYARAYDASRRLNDRVRGLRTLNALTNALLDRGALDKARETAAEAYRLALRDNDVAAQATAQNNLAEADRLAGRLAAAREGYERALSLARQTDSRAAVASILLNLGVTERRAGRLAKARARFAEARELARGLDDARGGAYAEWNLEQIDAEIQKQGGTR